MRALNTMAMPVDQALVRFFMTFSITPLPLAPTLTLPRYAREGTRQRSFVDIPSLAPQARGGRKTSLHRFNPLPCAAGAGEG
jgi:hypothetical protein